MVLKLYLIKNIIQYDMFTSNCMLKACENLKLPQKWGKKFLFNRFFYLNLILHTSKYIEIKLELENSIVLYLFCCKKCFALDEGVANFYHI